MVSRSCPKSGEGFSILAGTVRVDIDASDPCTAIVDQQADTVLDEAPPAELATASVISEGTFYDVEKSGQGTVRLHQLADRRRVLRFENIEVSNNTDLFVWLTDHREPRTSAEAVEAKRVVLGNLNLTVGNQNHEVPASVPTERL